VVPKLLWQGRFCFCQKIIVHNSPSDLSSQGSIPAMTAEEWFNLSRFCWHDCSEVPPSSNPVENDFDQGTCGYPSWKIASMART
jgi:hypothetical protein